MIHPIRLYLCIFMLCFSLNGVYATRLLAEYDGRNKQVKLSWDQIEQGSRQFILQKSTDQFNWDDLAVQTIPDNSNIKLCLYYDKQPIMGRSYYRLKIQADKNFPHYSATALLDIESSSNKWVIYPVPVRDVLTLQYKGADPIKGVINVFIRSLASGTDFSRVRCASCTSTIQIPVENLGKGVYDIRIVILNEVVWSQRFIK